jgi:TatD DNase family protein
MKNSFWNLSLPISLNSQRDSSVMGDHPLVDSHCHVNFQDFEGDLGDVMQRAENMNVKYMLCVSVDLATIPDIISLTEEYPNVFASVGMHPNLEMVEGRNPTIDNLYNASMHSKVIAIGETGLDYYRSSGDLAWQRKRFRLHIECAKMIPLPLIVHTRNAREDTMDILVEEKAKDCGGVMHCFTENWNMAKRALDLGFYISISGIVTFKKSDELREVAKKIPLDRLLIETDAPYLAPEPNRGRRNEPSFVTDTAQSLSQLRGESYGKLCEATTDNFFRLFSKASRKN